MATIDTQIPLVDRVQELEELKTHLHNAIQGQGNLVFIAGEAGVGKTRLVEELKIYAQSQGIQVLQGWSLYESLTPYMPFVEALKSANLDHLFSREEPPKVECVYLITDTGLLIKDVVRQETKLDSTIFAGMLTAVGDFVKDSLSILSGEERKETLDSIGYEKYRILIEKGTNTNLAVILTGRENEFLVNDMREVLVNVEKDFGNVLKAWDGDDNSVKGINNLLRPLIESGKYDGIDYAKDDPKVKRNRLFENISLGIERHTKVNPSILCIEDLQWADPSSLALMHYIARNTRKCDLLILGTYRPEDVAVTEGGKPHHLIEAMQLMSREDLYQKVELNRIEERYIDDMLISLLGKIDFTEEFKHQIYRETEGNPFFINSLIRMLIEEGTIVFKDDAWILAKELKEANMPSKVYDVIIRRLYRVKERQREILEYAAVMGEEFSSDVLVRIMGINKIQLLKELRTLEQNHKLIRLIEPKYKFDHAKIKEVLTSQIPADLKKEYHKAIAESIVTIYKENHDRMIGDLAYHFYNSSNKKRALPYLIKLGIKAKNEYSNQEGIKYFTQALELETDEQKKCMVVESLGDIFFTIGDYEKSQELYERALTHNHEMKKKAELLMKIGYSFEMYGRYNEVLKITTEALKLVNNEECKEKALALRQIGFIYSRFGNYSKAFQNLERSLEIFNILNDLKGISITYINMGLLYEGQNEFEKAIEITTKSLMIEEKIGDLFGISACIFNIGFYYTKLENYEKALECHLNNIARIKKTGNPAIESYTYWDLAEIYFIEGDIKKSLYYTNQAFNLSKRIGFKEVIAASYRCYGMIYGHQKKWDESIKNFNKSIELFDEMGFKVEVRRSYHYYGLMLKAKGDTEKAKDCFDKASRILEEVKSGECLENLRAVLMKYR